MAQYYQVTSLEELNRLYPNLQLENVEGIHGVVPDVAQYTEIQVKSWFHNFEIKN